MKMNILGVCLLFLYGSVFAQEALVGKYSGSWVYPSNRGDVSGTLALEVTSVDGETVKGKATRAAQIYGGCDGEYPVAGTLKGNELTLRSTTKGGRARDCNLTARFTVEGNKLVGTLGQFKATLSK